jgi:biopolymer transport protein ExbD
MARRSANRRRKGNGEVRLNITSMMDMFTIILVFLLKSFSAQGQLVTPAQGLKIPGSSTDSAAIHALDIEISMDHKGDAGRTERGEIVIEGKSIMYTMDVAGSKEFLIPELQEVLQKYSEEAQKTAEILGQEFKGNINIQADTSVSYDILTKTMFTCGRSGFPNMQLLVYKEE